MTPLRISDRLGLARALIERYESEVKAKGSYKPAAALEPDLRSYRLGQLELALSENVLLLPTDPTTSSLLDVWGDTGKLFSVSWKPERPWLPPVIVSCKPGSWIVELGLGHFVRQTSALPPSAAP